MSNITSTSPMKPSRVGPAPSPRANRVTLDHAGTVEATDLRALATVGTLTWRRWWQGGAMEGRIAAALRTPRPLVMRTRNGDGGSWRARRTVSTVPPSDQCRLVLACITDLADSASYRLAVHALLKDDHV